jgi:putative peptidoglycan lipid II flippase
LGHGGLALANSVASTVEMIILIEVLRRRLGGIEGRQLGPALLKTGAATALMALALAVTLRVLPPLPGAIVAIVGMIVGGAVFVGTAFGLRVPEMELVRRMLVRFAPALRRRAPGGERQHP